MHNIEKAEVEVYTRQERVALFLNGKKVAEKSRGKDCRIVFRISYSPGTLTAVSYDRDIEYSRYSLKTAEEETILSLVAENNSLKGELSFIDISFTDKNSIVKPLERDIVTVNVVGGELLAVGSACPYNVIGFCTDHTDTYYGRALAVVKEISDVCVVKATTDKLSAEISI